MDSLINTPPPATFKEKFELKLAEYEQQNQGSKKKPWTSERISKVINIVRKASMTSTQPKTSMDYYWISKYDTMVVAEEVFLIYKKKSPDDPTVRIVPRNEYFDTLEDIHNACGHGGRDKMLHAIKSRYHISRKAIEIFLALCPTCGMKKPLLKKVIKEKPLAEVNVVTTNAAEMTPNAKMDVLIQKVDELVNEQKETKAILEKLVEAMESKISVRL